MDNKQELIKISVGLRAVCVSNIKWIVKLVELGAVHSTMFQWKMKRRGKTISKMHCPIIHY